MTFMLMFLTMTMVLTKYSLEFWNLLFTWSIFIEYICYLTTLMLMFLTMSLVLMKLSLAITMISGLYSSF